METQEIEIKHAKVPFTIEEMIEYFLNKNKFYIINYKDSELKGNRFLSYVGNLEIPFEINYIGVSKEEKFELVLEFLKSRNIIKLGSLALTSAEILLRYRGLSNLKISTNPIFSDSEFNDFIKENEEIISKWTTFVLSTNLFMLTTVKELNEGYNFKEGFKEIEDANYIGQNIVQLFSVPSFMEAFFSLPIDREIFFFKHQFEDYMFKGNNLFFYYGCPENMPYVIFDSMIRGTINPEQIEEIRKASP